MFHQANLLLLNSAVKLPYLSQPKTCKEVNTNWEIVAINMSHRTFKEELLDPRSKCNKIKDMCHL